MKDIVDAAMKDLVGELRYAAEMWITDSVLAALLIKTAAELERQRDEIGRLRMEVKTCVLWP